MSHIACVKCASARQLKQTPAKQAEIDEHMSKRPFLAETPTEAERMAHAGRSWPALKESKEFDRQRILESPLFDRRLF